MTTLAQGPQFFVSPLGNDEWYGTLPEPNAQKTDGPFATINRAIKGVRQERLRRKFSEPATIILRGGRYHLPWTLTLGPDDSFISFAAHRDERVSISGGLKVTGWKPEQVNGVAAWVADATILMEKAGYFHQLFASDKRCARPRVPEVDYSWMEDVPGTDKTENDNRVPFQKKRFVAKPGDVSAWRNLTDVEAVVLHWWIEERRNLADFDPATRMVTLGEDTNFILVDDLNAAFARYYIENVFEALKKPGQWYLDRAAKKLHYIPRAGETIENTEVFIPKLVTLVKLAGDVDKERPVQSVSFSGITFEHGEWKDVNKNGQAAFWMPAAIQLEAARNCTIEDCVVQHVGVWGIDIGRGCLNNRILRTHISDIGAGGIKVTGGSYWDPLPTRCGSTTINDNEISAVGRVHHSATGVLLGHTFGNLVMHNHIFDTYYTGISVGWVWAYYPSVASDNRIEKNHIHHCGQGMLNDMGGVYLLGPQPGTAVRGNLIHDIISKQYGGWGIYPDEGTSFIVIENNVVFNTSSQPYHLHFGREIGIRNNIWALGGEGIIAISRGTAMHRPERNAYPDGSNTNCFTFERNIVLTDGQPVFVGGMDDDSGKLETRSFISDLNVFWDVNNAPLFAVNAGHMMAHEGYKRRFSWEEFRALGYDRFSRTLDPRIGTLDGARRVFGEDSPACELGFVPIDMRDVGPRGEKKREEPHKAA